MKKALIVHGGWEGHEPKLVADIFETELKKLDFEVTVKDSLDAFLDKDYLMTLDLIVPIWTMGEINEEQAKPVMEAVEAGVGIAGCHGGMCDAFRNHVGWQFMTGGQWVAHPGNDGTKHEIIISNSSSPIVEGIKDFVVETEQYYLHVDPANEVLAYTVFPVADGPHSSNKRVAVPVVWTKRWGKGKVFYNSLGHHADVFDHEGAIEMMRRGFVWAAKR